MREDGCSGRPEIYRRLVAIAPVLLLHLGLLIAFLNMSRGPLMESNIAGIEIILLLKPIPATPSVQGHLLPSFNRGSIAFPQFSLPSVSKYNVAPGNWPQMSPEVPGVAHALFQCWPVGAINSAQVQDAQCLTVAPGMAPWSYEPRAQSRNEAEWLRDWKRKNAPVRLPCTYGMSLSTVICAANGLVNGFDLENAPSYAEDDDAWHMSGADTIRHQMQTFEPCALDRTRGLGFVCLYRVVNGNAPP